MIPLAKPIRKMQIEEDDAPLVRPIRKMQIEEDEDIPLARPIRKMQIEEDDVSLVRPIRKMQIEEEEDDIPLDRPIRKIQIEEDVNQNEDTPTPDEPGTPDLIPIKIENGKHFIKGTRVVVDPMNCIVVGIVYHSAFIRALLPGDREVCKRYKIPYLGDLLQECGIIE
jgi:hypothetical protein